MKYLTLLMVLFSILFAQEPIIKIKGQNLLKALAYTENTPYTKLYDWNIGDAQTSIIRWDENGNNWSPEGFERKGKVSLSNNGKITHTIVDNEIKLGYWTLLLLGNKDKIINATIIPNIATLENPSILIDKTFIKEQIVCQENDKLKVTAYKVKYPKKISFWMQEETTISTKGNKSEYTISFDKKPNCTIKAMTNKPNSTNRISNSTKEQIKNFIKSFYKAGEEEFPGKTLPYYASSVDRYFSIKNPSKEDILEDKIRYYRKWTTRKYDLKDLSVIDTYVADGIQYYVINVVSGWSVISRDGQSNKGTSYNIITLIESSNGFLVKAIKSLGESTENVNYNTNKKIVYEEDSFLEKKKERLYQKSIEPKTKTISFSENGIKIQLTYPSFIKAGETFKIHAKMTNNSAKAKQGGLTLSFPNMRQKHLNGRVLKNNFSLLKGYSYPDKIYSKSTRKNMRTNYYMIEGWQKKTWLYGKTKHFSVELTAPKNLNDLFVNLRAVIWIKGKHDTREIPVRSLKYDQQGFAVKQFTISIN